MKWKVAPLYINHMRRTTSNLLSTNKWFKFSLKKLVYDSPDNFSLKKSSVIKWWAIIPTHALTLNWCLVVWEYNCACTYFILIIYVRFAFTAHCFSIKKNIQEIHWCLVISCISRQRCSAGESLNNLQQNVY